MNPPQDTQYSWSAPADPSEPHRLLPVIIDFPISRGVVYFEVNLQTSGRMQFGWTTRLAKFEEGSLIGEKYSLGRRSDLLTAGQSVGCLLDTDRKRATFHINGHWDDASGDHWSHRDSFERNLEMFEYSPFFAAASLAPGQKISFNLGQNEFRHTPNVEYESILAAAQASGHQCRLLEAKRLKNTFQFDFGHLQTSIVLFHDGRQRELDRWVHEEEERIVQGLLTESESLKPVPDPRRFRGHGYGFGFEFGRGQGHFGERQESANCRYVQAMLEVLGDRVVAEKIPILAWWISEVIRLKAIYSDPLLMTLLPPYLDNQDNRDVIKTRHLCIILASLSGKTLAPLNEKLTNYLMNVLVSSEDIWTQLYAMVAVEQMAEKGRIVGHEVISQKIATWSREFGSEDELAETSKINLEITGRLQRYIVARALRTGLDSDQSTDFFRINPEDRSKSTLVSPSKLMARSDHFGQTARSHFALNLGTFYFEVIVLTAGPMRIGLAARQMDLETDTIGESAFSIGFDGYHGCVWKSGKQYLPKSGPLPRWKVGDVVNVHFDSFGRSVTFGLNGQIIELAGNPFHDEFIFSKLECHIAATLYAHQQCYFKFQPSIAPAFQAKGCSIVLEQLRPASASNPPYTSNYTAIPDEILNAIFAILLTCADPAKIKQVLMDCDLEHMEMLADSLYAKHQSDSEQDQEVCQKAQLVKKTIADIRKERGLGRAAGQTKYVEKDQIQ